MDHIALLILGIFIAIIGIVNIMGNISTIHSYNRRKVREEDVPKYGRAVGTGTLIIGVSLIAAFVIVSSSGVAACRSAFRFRCCKGRGASGRARQLL